MLVVDDIGSEASSSRDPVQPKAKLTPAAMVEARPPKPQAPRNGNEHRNFSLWQWRQGYEQQQVVADLEVGDWRAEAEAVFPKLAEEDEDFFSSDFWLGQKGDLGTRRRALELGHALRARGLNLVPSDQPLIDLASARNNKARQPALLLARPLLSSRGSLGVGICT